MGEMVVPWFDISRPKKCLPNKGVMSSQSPSRLIACDLREAFQSTSGLVGYLCTKECGCQRRGRIRKTFSLCVIHGCLLCNISLFLIQYCV